MKKAIHFLNLTTLLCLCVLFVHCGSDDTEVSILDRIEITSSSGNKLDIAGGGGSSTLTASGFDQFNQPFELTDPIWSVDNDIVSIDQEGKASATSIGKSVITVSSGTVEATYTITVWDSSAPRTEFYVSDAGTNTSPPFRIIKFDEEGNNPEVFITQNLSWPQDIIFLEEEGTVLVSNLTSGNITRYDATTGSYINNFATGIQGPTRMKIGADNLLYVLQWNGPGYVLRYNLDGTLEDQFTTVGVIQSIGLDWDTDGNLYVSSFQGKSVRKFDPSGNDMGLFVNSVLQGPTNIWFDEDGILLVNDWTGGKVSRFSSTGSYVDDLITGLNRPEGIEFLDNGNLLIGDAGARAVKMFDSNGVFLRNFTVPGAGGLVTPNAVIRRDVNK